MRELALKQSVRLGVSVLVGMLCLLFAYAKSHLDSAIEVIFLSGGALAAAYATFILYPFQERALLKGRSSMPIKEIFAKHYSDSNLPWDSFERYWREIASILGESAEVLRPSDRFDKELKPRTPLDESNDDLVRFVLKELGTTVQADLKETETLDSLIKLLCLRKPNKAED